MEEIQDHVTEDDLASFAEHLAAHAAGMSRRERQLLLTVLFAAMDPIDRMAWRDPPVSFTSVEEACLRMIENGRTSELSA